MIPGIFTEFQADQLVRDTVKAILVQSDIPPTTVNSVEIQHDMVRTPRHKVGKGPEENWIACWSGSFKKTMIPMDDTNLEWVVS